MSTLTEPRIFEQLLDDFAAYVTTEALCVRDGFATGDGSSNTRAVIIEQLAELRADRERLGMLESATSIFWPDRGGSIPAGMPIRQFLDAARGVPARSGRQDMSESERKNDR